jgi:hypothetical protein
MPESNGPPEGQAAGAAAPTVPEQTSGPSGGPGPESPPPGPSTITGPPGPSGAPTGTGDEAYPAWAASLSNLVIGGVGSLKAKATVKVLIVLRFVMYGLVILVASMTAVVLLTIGVVRMWDAYLPISPVGRRVWLGYVVFGGLLFVVGGWLLRKKRQPK